MHSKLFDGYVGCLVALNNFRSKGNKIDIEWDSLYDPSRKIGLGLANYSGSRYLIVDNDCYIIDNIRMSLGKYTATIRPSSIVLNTAKITQELLPN